MWLDIIHGPMDMVGNVRTVLAFSIYRQHKLYNKQKIWKIHLLKWPKYQLIILIYGLQYMHSPPRKQRFRIYDIRDIEPSRSTGQWD